MKASVLLLLFSATAMADPPAAGTRERVASPSATLAPGTTAPEFMLPSTSGKPVQLSKLRKSGPVVPKRVTSVIAQNGRIEKVIAGKEAIDAGSALSACEAHPVQ
jgi:peroxiredoxin